MVAVSLLASAPARAFNFRHRRVGHLWQGRYKAIVVGDGVYLSGCSRYIHLNPNRARITRPARDSDRSRSVARSGIKPTNQKRNETVA